jgi:hypothetical protein
MSQLQHLEGGWTLGAPEHGEVGAGGRQSRASSDEGRQGLATRSGGQTTSTTEKGGIPHCSSR